MVMRVTARALSRVTRPSGTISSIAIASTTTQTFRTLPTTRVEAATPIAATTSVTSRRWLAVDASTVALVDGMPMKSAYGWTRRPDFARVTADDLTFFRSLIGNDNVITDERLKSMNGDWMRKYRGYSKVALRPATTMDVSKILKYCNDRRLAIVPQGGNTGLVGGSIPLFDEIILSTTRMNKVVAFDEHSGVLTYVTQPLIPTHNNMYVD
jgi:hypothetical protein